jgi:dTDP-glucose pyrophosphorylase/predicted transcriptional regulator
MVEKYCTEPSASILDAMKKINDAAIASVVVCEDGKAKGVLTDGDIRRALISGAALTDSISEYYTTRFISVGVDVLRADVLELMRARMIEQVPILDECGALIGIHTLHKLLGNDTKPNWALIMAGGKGARLGRLAAETPKPMLKVAGKPILERLVLHLINYGIRRIFISVNHLSHVIEEYFGDGSEWGCSIEYLREIQPLGSGGALSLFPELPECPVILINGDLLLEADLSQMLAFHETNQLYATMGVHYYSHEIPFGCVETNQNRIVGLEEKPVFTKTINGGVYVLSPEAVQSVPKNTFFPITGLFERAFAERLPCGAYPLDGDWIDVGVPEQLKQARGHA